jgi:hypothetical protein
MGYDSGMQEKVERPAVRLVSVKSPYLLQFQGNAVAVLALLEHDQTRGRLNGQSHLKRV